MHFTMVLSAAAALAGLSVAAPMPFSIPTDDGFPNPSPAQLKVIQQIADGTLSNAPPPAKLNDSSIVNFQLIAHNENFEVAFFSSLLYNITNNVPGFELPNPKKKEELIDIVETVLAVSFFFFG